MTKTGCRGTLGRDDRSQPVLIHRLQAAAEQLNPGVPKAALDQAVEKFSEFRDIDG